MLPTLIRTVNMNASRVELADGVAYVTMGSGVRAIDVLTGEIIQTLGLPGSTLTDIARDGLALFTMDTNRVLTAIDISDFEMQLRGSASCLTVAASSSSEMVLPMPRLGCPGGYATVDVTDLDNLTVISGSDVPSNEIIASAGLALNGSGLALLVGSGAFGANTFYVLNSSDPNNTYQFETLFPLPARQGCHCGIRDRLRVEHGRPASHQLPVVRQPASSASDFD